MRMKKDKANVCTIHLNFVDNIFDFIGYCRTMFGQFFVKHINSNSNHVERGAYFVSNVTNLIKKWIN